MSGSEDVGIVPAVACSNDELGAADEDVGWPSACFAAVLSLWSAPYRVSSSTLWPGFLYYVSMLVGDHGGAGYAVQDALDLLHGC